MVNSTDVQTILDADLLCLIRKYRITKVRSRQAVKLPAVQPVVIRTGHWPAVFKYFKFLVNIKSLVRPLRAKRKKSLLNRKKRKKEYFWSKSSLLQKIIERINFPQIKKSPVGAGFAVEMTIITLHLQYSRKL